MTISAMTERINELFYAMHAAGLGTPRYCELCEERNALIMARDALQKRRTQSECLAEFGGGERRLTDAPVKTKAQLKAEVEERERRRREIAAKQFAEFGDTLKPRTFLH